MIVTFTSEEGIHYPKSYEELKRWVLRQDGHVAVMYPNRLGRSSTLFLTVVNGVAYHRFKHEVPIVNWEWLAQALSPACKTALQIP